MKKILMLVSLAIPVLALAVSAQDSGKKALSQLGGEQSLSQAAAAPVPLPVVADIPSARPWPSYPPPPAHVRMECRAYDKGWEEHWGGHGGGPNEFDACRACFAKHGECRFDCTVDMFRCEARFNAYNQPPQPGYPPVHPYPNPGQPGYNPYPPGYNPNPGYPGYNPYPPANPHPNPGHPGYNPHPGYPPPPPPPGHWTPNPPGHNPYHKAGPGLYSGDLRPDRRSAEDSAVRNCTQANYGVPGYCTVSSCTPQRESVKSGRCRK